MERYKYNGNAKDKSNQGKQVVNSFDTEIEKFSNLTETGIILTETFSSIWNTFMANKSHISLVFYDK